MGERQPLRDVAVVTYRQSLDFIRVHCDFLSAAEKALIVDGNAVRLFGLEHSAPRI